MSWTGGFDPSSLLGAASLPACYGDSRWSPPIHVSSETSSSSTSLEEQPSKLLQVAEAGFPADELVASLNHLVDSDRSSSSPLSEYGSPRYNSYGRDLPLNPPALPLARSSPHIPEFDRPSPTQPVHQLLSFHQLVQLSQQSQPAQLPQQPQPAQLPPLPPCVNNIHNRLSHYCLTCSEDYCDNCGSANHVSHVTKEFDKFVQDVTEQASEMMKEARITMGHLRTDFDNNQLTLESSQVKAREISGYVCDTFRQINQRLATRERQLQDEIECYKEEKTKVLRARDDTLKICINKVKKSIDRLSEASRAPRVGPNLGNLVRCKDRVSGEMFNVRQLRSSLPVTEENWLSFEPPSAAARQALGSVGTLNYRAPRCVSGGFGGRRHQGNGERFEFELRASSPPGWAITAGGCHVPIAMAFGKPYSEICRTIKYFGTGYSPEGLCRPWGVTSDHEGNLLVADRSNCRIVIWRPDGSLVRMFGSFGTAVGQFDRPAGLAVDARKRIIVADKDNHRIQVFTMEGKFLFTFGKRGQEPGEFNFPWDVAVNAECQIAVSDSRNHRVQLFSPEGVFLRKYGFEGNSSSHHKFFDSPRGIAFNPKGQILVNDFNNHRVVLIEPDMMRAHILIGEKHGMRTSLQRPQGLTVDDSGNIYVTDSKNYRVVMYDESGTYVWEFGSQDVQGSRRGGMDRPSGIALTREGRIAVVDFGHNRLQLI